MLRRDRVVSTILERKRTAGIAACSSSRSRKSPHQVSTMRIVGGASSSSISTQCASRTLVKLLWVKIYPCDFEGFLF